MEAQKAKKPIQPTNKLKYADQHQKLIEMGFDTKSINIALESTQGDLQAATALLLDEANATATNSDDSVAPMKVVGKSSQVVKPVISKAETIKETHNKFMAIYKTTKCKDKSNHDKRMCFYWHTKSDRRRNPFEVLYTCTECPNSTDTLTCENGDSCLKAHNMLERMFHPELFKISMCQRGPNGNHCERGNLCAFAHSDEDHRIPLSQTIAKSHVNSTISNSTTSNIAQVTNGLNPLSGAASTDPIVPGKSMSDSRLLDNIQEKLVRLIKSQGSEGIISSELPKRFSDAYSERLELADESGEKFRIKDLLLSHPHISVSMHKGVQPKYVYDDIEESKSITTASNDKNLAKVTVAIETSTHTALFQQPISYSAVATGSSNTQKSVKTAPLNYAAALTESNSIPTVPAPTAADKIALKDLSTTFNQWQLGPGGLLESKSSTVSTNDTTVAVDQSTTSTSTAIGSNVTNSSITTGSIRRRGPDPILPNNTDTELLQQSLKYNSMTSSSISAINGNKSGPPGLAANTSILVPSNNNSNNTTTTTISSNSSSNSPENLQQQIHLLQSELNRKVIDYDTQSLQVQDLIQKLNELENQQSIAYNARESALSEVYRVHMELDEIKNKNEDINMKSNEIRSRDYTISHLKQEKSVDLHQYYSSINQIEIALIEMQRKEALYINEIPLHDTINESSRARDELTKFVSLLKMQINSKIMLEANNNQVNNFLPSNNNQINNINFQSNTNYLNNNSNVSGVNNKYLNEHSSKRGNILDDLNNMDLGHSLHLNDDDDDFSHLISAATSNQTLNIRTNNNNNNNMLNNNVLSINPIINTSINNNNNRTSRGFICGLSGCHLEGTFICSACNRIGYCGTEHQRDHWIMHMAECNQLN